MGRRDIKPRSKIDINPSSKNDTRSLLNSEPKLPPKSAAAEDRSASRPEGEGSDLTLPKRGARPQRTPSGVNARKVSEGLQQLSPDTMRRLRDSFSLLDSDGSGTVGREALQAMLQSLGLPAGAQTMDSMMKRTGEPVTFGNYLAVMAELLCGLPSRHDLDYALEAFTRPDGSFDVAYMRSTLLDHGVSARDLDAIIDKYTKRSSGGGVFDPRAFSESMGV